MSFETQPSTTSGPKNLNASDVIHTQPAEGVGVTCLPDDHTTNTHQFPLPSNNSGGVVSELPEDRSRIGEGYEDHGRNHSPASDRLRPHSRASTLGPRVEPEPEPEPEPVQPNRRVRPDPPGILPPITSGICSILGLNTPKLSLAWAIFFNTAQITSIVVLLWLASLPGSALPIPNQDGGLARVAGKSQWETCYPAISVWNAAWMARALLGIGLGVWRFSRAVRPSLDQLLLRQRVQPLAPGGDLMTDTTAEEGVNTAENTASETSREGQIARQRVIIEERWAREQQWYARLVAFHAAIGMFWFCSANLLLYYTLNTCRHTSPFVWWLMFGILCLGYVIVVECIVIAVVIFILGPMLYLAVNMVLICTGRPPLRPGALAPNIDPEVPKLPRRAVERIPLVVYIPAPENNNLHVVEPTTTETQVEHVYPPPAAKLNPDSSTARNPSIRPRRRFFFLRRKTPLPKQIEPQREQDTDIEAGWETSEYPFVKLEANRASCVICWSDFEPPKRVAGHHTGIVPEETDTRDHSAGIQQADRSDADGSGQAEPLRLLACGHVFHQECLDPWLVDVSGRCPTCQRPVEEGDLEPERGGVKKKRRLGRA